MIRLIAAAFALVAATSAHAVSLAPLHQSHGIITQVREACGAGSVRINGICVVVMSVEQSAGVRDGREVLAFGTTETNLRVSGLSAGRCDRQLAG